MNKQKLFFSILVLWFLQGCGQSGPLYLPDSKPPVYVPTSPNQVPQK